jgi:hypothetical protein
MKALVHYKAEAIALRQKGYTYNEIKEIVPVAKSSLSLWLKDLPLTKSEKIALKHRKNARISNGRIKVAGILHTRRLAREKDQLSAARLVFKQHAQDPFFHAGLNLYWAEGGKRTNQWQFMNSDADMHRVMLSWLVKFADLNKKDLRFRLYIHKPYLSESCDKWWIKKLQVEPSQFLKTVIKPSGLGIKKRPNYRGCLRVEVRSSKALLNKMRFWQNMLVEFYLKQ